MRKANVQSGSDLHNKSSTKSASFYRNPSFASHAKSINVTNTYLFPYSTKIDAFDFSTFEEDSPKTKLDRLDLDDMERIHADLEGLG